MNMHRALPVALSLAFIVATVAHAAQAEDPAVGFWSTQLNFPSGMSGALTLSKGADAWRASLNGSEVVSPAGPQMKFTFPHGKGELRVSAEGDNVRAFWITPSVFLTPTREPGSATQPFATPLKLTATGRNRWQGTVAPLEVRFTLYLKVYRDPEGRLVAAFRNPEYNFNGGHPLFNVAHKESTLRFSVTRAEAGRDIAFDATLRAPDRLEIFWPPVARTLHLERRTPAEIPDFFPRSPNPGTYVYRTPQATDDGWSVAPANTVGFDEKALALAVQKIIDVDPASRRAWLIHSLAIARHGKLVLDEYFYGHERERPHDTRSAGKTLSSVMLGALMRQGSALSPQTKVYELLAPLGPFAHPDPRKAKITLAHLLTHTAGLACDDNDENSPYTEDKMQTQTDQPNWWKYSLDLPMAFEPGDRYAYCSGNINLVGAALTISSQTWLPELFDRTVAQPLQFGSYYWNLMPNYEGYFGGGAFLRTRDLLKVGQAYLDGGEWNGRRIATTAWTKEAMSPHARISPATTGRSGEDFANVYYETDEGYAWHMIDVKFGGKRYPAFHANGNGGQLLLIVPQFDLVVAFTAGNYGQGLWNRERDDITGGLIIPALRD